MTATTAAAILGVTTRTVYRRTPSEARKMRAAGERDMFPDVLKEGTLQ